MRTSRFRSNRWLVAAATVVSLTALTACGSSDGDSNSDPNAVVVGSANFTESETIANIYAEALRVNGFDVSTSFNVGSREAYIPALKDGSISVIPDYTGNLLQYLDPDSTATSSADVLAALPAALGSELAIATPASAEVKFGAPAEFQERPAGLPGLKSNYGLDISAANFVPIADGGGPATVKALSSGDITAANIFTTSASIPANNFVVLEDPQNNFPAQNVVPVLRASKSSDKLKTVLDAVSAKLTTEELLALNVQVSGDTKTEPAAAAKAWVTAQGLDKPVS
jgi:osmoprotectant transport system substrate-binding protein